MTTSTRIALIAAVVAASGWTAKSIAIGLAGGNDLSPLEGPLFLVGLIALLVAAASLGVALTRDQPLWLRAAAGLVGPLLGFAAAMAIDSLVGVIRGPSEGRHWVWVELNLWVIGLATLVLAVRLARRADERPAQA